MGSARADYWPVRTAPCAAPKQIVYTSTDPEFDADKDAINVAKHDISLARASDFIPKKTLPDDRFDYGEKRFRSWGVIDGEKYFLSFTMRDGRVRAISLRRMHQKEWKRHVPE